MFADPLVVPNAIDGTMPLVNLVSQFALVDASITGRTIRTASAGVFNTASRLTISHSETKENKPFGMKRVNLRLDADISDVEVSVSTAVPFVQFTMGLPKTPMVTTTDLAVLAQQLALLILTGSKVNDAAVSTADGSIFIGRLLAGEG